MCTIGQFKKININIYDCVINTTCKTNQIIQICCNILLLSLIVSSSAVISKEEKNRLDVIRTTIRLKLTKEQKRAFDLYVAKKTEEIYHSTNPLSAKECEALLYQKGGEFLNISAQALKAETDLSVETIIKYNSISDAERTPEKLQAALEAMKQYLTKTQ